MDIQRTPHVSIDQVAESLIKNRQVNNTSDPLTHNGLTFKQILESKTEGTGEIFFSKHASQRLKDRGIDLSKDQLFRLAEGTDRAMAKGIRDSLVLMDDLAFIVNVPNKTVITAMDSNETKENVFTNINGAVIC